MPLEVRVFAFQTINIGDWFWGDRLESPLIPGTFQELKLSVSLVSLFKLRKHWLLSQTDPWKLNSLLVCVEIIKLVIFESVKTQLTKVVLIAIRVRASVTYYSWVRYLPDLCQNYVCISSKTIVKIPKKFFLDLLSIRSDVFQSLRSNVSMPDCSVEVSAVPCFRFLGNRMNRHSRTDTARSGHWLDRFQTAIDLQVGSVYLPHYYCVST